MRKLVLLLCIFFCGQIAFGQTSNYCKGFIKGFKIGYCYNKKKNDVSVTCVPPTAPSCPQPAYGESSSSYDDGYIVGYIKGNNTSEEENSNYNSKDNYSTGKSVFKSHGYVPPLDLELLERVNKSKEELFEKRGETIQKNINGMFTLISNMLGNGKVRDIKDKNNRMINLEEAYNRLANKLVTEINSVSRDLTDDNQFNFIMNKITALEKDVIEAYTQFKK